MTANPALASYLSIFRSSPGSQKFSAGDVIFKEGDTGDSMYVVLDGAVRVEINGQPVTGLHAGEMFGEMALVDNSPRSATVIADSDCSLAVIDEKRFEEMIRETPYFYKHLLHLLADRLRKRETAS